MLVLKRGKHFVFKTWVKENFVMSLIVAIKSVKLKHDEKLRVLSFLCVSN